MTVEINDKDVQDWQDELKTHSTKVNYVNNLAIFTKWLETQGKSLNDFKAMTTKDRIHLVLKWQSSSPLGFPRVYQSKNRKKPITREPKPLKPNSINAVLTALQSFCAFLDPDRPLPLKGKRIDSEEDINSYDFTKEDLAKLYDTQDLRGKAIIACASSCGLESSSFLKLDKKQVESELRSLEERTKDNPEEPQFIFFDSIRGKTKVKGLVVLNPLAVESLRAWLPLNKGSNLFDISKSGLTKFMQSATKKANLDTRGKNTRFHKFRSWVMTNLIRAGFSDFETKIIVHKSVPKSDNTYLKLKDSIIEKYPQVYDQFLNIRTNNGNGKVLKAKVEALGTTTEQLVKLLAEKDEEIKRLKDQLSAQSQSTQKEIVNLQEQINQILTSLGKKPEPKPSEHFTLS